MNKKWMATLCLLLMLGGCGTFVTERQVIQAVEKQGYTDIAITRKHIFFLGCNGGSKSDDAVFHARATNPAGQRVDILICAGLFKGVTVRTE